MKVKELLELINGYDPEMEVVVRVECNADDQDLEHLREQSRNE